MARTLGATNLTAREHNMKATISLLRGTMAGLKKENKALREALRLAQKAASKK